jgi:hypothetical protein
MAAVGDDGGQIEAMSVRPNDIRAAGHLPVKSRLNHALLNTGGFQTVIQ